MKQIDELSREARMRRSFTAEVQKILRHPDHYRTDSRSITVGLESEVAIIPRDLELNTSELARQRDHIRKTVPGTDVELGARQLELRTEPFDLKARAIGELSRTYESLAERVTSAAHAVGGRVLRCGASPFGRPIETDLERTDKEKYRLVPDFQNRNRRATAPLSIGRRGPQVVVNEASVVSLFQSFQVNLAAHSLEDGIMKLNYALMVAPYLVAASGNARFLGCADTGMNDLRILAWERSHDTRTRDEVRRGNGLRVGLPERYFRNIEEYFTRVGSYPFILDDTDHAFQIGVGLHWLDARLKIMGTAPVVELRALSTQPSPKDELALTLWFVGRLLAACRANEPLLPFALLRENRLAALLDGTDTCLWVRTPNGLLKRMAAPETLRIDLELAFKELVRCGIYAPGAHERLIRHIAHGPPSATLARALGGRERVTNKEMARALESCSMLS